MTSRSMEPLDTEEEVGVVGGDPLSIVRTWLERGDGNHGEYDLPFESSRLYFQGGRLCKVGPEYLATALQTVSCSGHAALIDVWLWCRGTSYLTTRDNSTPVDISP